MVEYFPQMMLEYLLFYYSYSYKSEISSSWLIVYSQEGKLSCRMSVPAASEIGMSACVRVGALFCSTFVIN